MCGIAGVLSAMPTDSIAVLRAMAGRLSHRGPDDTRYFQQSGVGLAHTRLSIVDLQGGAQPLQTDDGRYTLVANGEIYNHVELRQALLAEGCRFSTHSDCETALHAFALDGIQSVHRLHGMFSIAIYDAKSSSLWLMRDRLGIKPLYYLSGPSLRAPYCFAFASEIKALLPLLEKEVCYHPQALREALECNYSSGRMTAVAGIQRVLPGEFVRVDAKSQKFECYWSAKAQPLDITSEEDAISALDSKFNLVVKEHLRSDVPVGAFLSGGLDSSTMLSTMVNLSSEPVETFTLGFTSASDSESMASEATIAAQTAARLGVPNHIQHIAEQDMMQWLPLSIWAADELMFDYANLPTMALASAAAQSHKVVFTGEGGDEIFAGYGRYRPRPARNFLRAMLNRTGFGQSRRRQKLAQGMFTPEFCRRSDASERSRTLATLTGDRDEDLRQAQIFDLENWLPNDLLVKADRMLMAFGVEGRVPYLDHRLVEFGISLPARLKVSGRRGKLLQRQWAERCHGLGYLSELPKRGFTTPILAWLQHERLSWIRPAIRQNRAIQSICTGVAIDQLFDDLGKKRQVENLIWALIHIAVWHQIFVEGNGQRPAPSRTLRDWLQP